MNESAEKSFNKALEGEISAVEAYQVAIQGLTEGSIEKKQVLGELLVVHQDACEKLRTHLRTSDEKPVEGSGWWGGVTGTAEKLAASLSEKLAVGTLKTGEQLGLKMYETFVKDEKLSSEERSLFESGIKTQKANIEKLSAL